MAFAAGAAGAVAALGAACGVPLSVWTSPTAPYKLGQLPPAEAYEAAAMGGVTRVVLDASSYARISSNLVLVGTVRNCAGGPSPWGWLSCEENTDINQGVRHGYTVVCPIDAESVQAPQKLA